MKIPILLFVFLSATHGKLWNPAFYPLSPYSGFSYSTPYEALLNYHRARYYARKAHDLAKLKSGVYGIGHGLYGYRYGGYSSKWSNPYITKSYGPFLPDVGLGYGQPFYHHGFPLKTFSYGNYYAPKSYGNSYAHNFAYGKEYLYSNKKSNVKVNAGWTTPNIVPSNKFFSSPIPVGKATPIILDSGVNSYSPGYQYSYFVRGPAYPQTDPSVKGYDSLYGNKYDTPGLGKDSAQVHGWKEAPVGTVLGEPPFVKIPFSDGPSYGSNYDSYPDKDLVSEPQVQFGYDSYPVDDSFGNKASFSLLPPESKEFSIPYDLFGGSSGDFSSRFDGKELSKWGDPRDGSVDPSSGIVPGSSELEAHGSSKSSVKEEKVKATMPEKQKSDKV